MVISDSTSATRLQITNLSRGLVTKILLLPYDSREYTKGAWHVQAHLVPGLIREAKASGVHPIITIDVTNAKVRSALQAVLSGATKWEPRTVRPTTSSCDFASLYLTSNAPEYIVDAVWKAVARKHHPDNGGNSDTFIKYKASYDQIKAKIRK